MQQSGTKLVIVLVGLAFVLGVVSWWYRFEAAHRTSQFWGSEASQLIAESENLAAIGLDPDSEDGLAAQLSAGESTDLSSARGQAHLRHAFLSDRNFVWDEPVEAASVEWRWCLRFHEGGRAAHVLLTEGLEVIGKMNLESEAVAAYSCEPMAASLKQYFVALGLLTKPQAVDASTTSE